MQNVQQTIEEALQPLNSGLEDRDRAIKVVQCEEGSVTVTLEGFCCTACDCVAAFKSRTRQIITSACPQISEVTFE